MSWKYESFTAAHSQDNWYVVFVTIATRPDFFFCNPVVLESICYSTDKREQLRLEGRKEIGREKVNVLCFEILCMTLPSPNSIFGVFI